METLNLKNLEIIGKYLKGKKLDTFIASVVLIQDSLKAGAWVPGASRSHDKGFSQGIYKLEVPPSPRWNEPKNPMYEARYEVAWVLRSAYSSPSLEQIEAVCADLSPKELKKISPEVIRAWASLCEEKRKAAAILDGRRPLPVVTAIGLSPKVTKTLKDMNLDLDLPSIKPAEIAYRLVARRHMDPKLPTYGMAMIGKSKGAEYCLLQEEPYVKWSENIVHGQSRFSARHGQCEACGKGIPSGNFVAIEAQDKRSGNLVSMWLGCDCAKNIFGVKDAGLKLSK